MDRRGRPRIAPGPRVAQLTFRPRASGRARRPCLPPHPFPTSPQAVLDCLRVLRQPKTPPRDIRPPPGDGPGQGGKTPPFCSPAPPTPGVSGQGLRPPPGAGGAEAAPRTRSPAPPRAPTPPPPAWHGHGPPPTPPVSPGPGPGQGGGGPPNPPPPPPPPRSWRGGVLGGRGTGGQRRTAWGDVGNGC